MLTVAIFAKMFSGLSKCQMYMQFAWLTDSYLAFLLSFTLCFFVSLCYRCSCTHTMPLLPFDILRIHYAIVL